jgi:hypothetical protein
VSRRQEEFNHSNEHIVRVGRDNHPLENANRRDFTGALVNPETENIKQGTRNQAAQTYRRQCKTNPSGVHRDWHVPLGSGVVVHVQ